MRFLRSAMRSSMRARQVSNELSSLPLGSSGPQSSRCAHGSAGHATPQPMVTTQSTGGISSSGFDRSPSVPYPWLASVCSVWWFMCSRGCVPAEQAAKVPFAICFAIASAIWLRHELCVQTKATRGIGRLVVWGWLRSGPKGSASCKGAPF